jgi:hypothetical protein
MIEKVKIKPVDLSYLADSWPSPIVPRNRVSEFSGGVVNPKHLANLDSQGLGPKGRFTIGRKVVYPVESLVSWLEERSAQRC